MPDQPVWIGGKSVTTWGDWSWTDGAAWSYINWADSQPKKDDMGMGDENCVAFNNWGNGLGQWCFCPMPNILFSDYFHKSQMQDIFYNRNTIWEGHWFDFHCEYSFFPFFCSMTPKALSIDDCPKDDSWPYTWKVYGRMCYSLGTTPMDWNFAKEQCDTEVNYHSYFL